MYFKIILVCRPVAISVVTYIYIYICHNRNRDRTANQNNFKIHKSHHYSLLWETRKTLKRKVFKTKFRIGTRLCVEKVLTSYDVSPKTISFIQVCKIKVNF